MMEVATIMEEEPLKQVLSTPPCEPTTEVETTVSSPELRSTDGVVGGERGVVDENTKPNDAENIQPTNDENSSGEMEILESKKLVSPSKDIQHVSQMERSTSAETVTVTEEDNDIIVLDDDDDDNDAGGLSEIKRARKDDDDEVMEVDENGIVNVTTEEKESAGKIIRKMARQDLEDLVLAKIVEAIVAHTEVGQLRAKVLELQMQKDKMAGKMGIMMKQVAELSSAINMIMENEARDPKNRIGKPHVIRFTRSVGLQTSIEPSVRSAPPRIIRVPEPSQNTNGMKNFGPSGKAAVQNNANSPFTVPQAVKRVYQGNKSSTAGNKSATNPLPTPGAQQRKVYSPATGPPRMYPIAPKPVSQQNVQTTAAAPSSQNVQPGVVDLTDDDPPVTTAAAPVPTSPGATPPTTTIINGVHYQIINRGAAPAPAGVQLSGPGQKYIVSPGSGQTRPLLPQMSVGTTPQQQQVMLRGVNNNSPVTIIQRPVASVAPRAPTNGSMPRVAAAIPGRPGSLLGAAATKRFVLPPLPPTPAPKGKNDQFKSPPKPELTLNEQTDGIVLSWNLPDATNMAEVTTYQIFACQESLSISSNRPSQWKRVGDVKALPLPMACTLSQFTEENRYHFIVRGIDVFGRVGPFCDPQNILLRKKKQI